MGLGDAIHDFFSSRGVIRQAADRLFAPGNWSALPTPGVDFRGGIGRVEGGAGVADRLVVCEKDASDVYAINDLGRAALDARYVNVSGDTMTGSLTLDTPALLDFTNEVGEKISLFGTASYAIGVESNETRISAGATSAPGITFRTNGYAGDERLRINATATVFNENGLASGDVRMEGDTVTDLFFLDASADTITFPDAGFRLKDNVDGTKLAQFQLSGLTTATTRTYTLPNVSGVINVAPVRQAATIASGVIALDGPWVTAVSLTGEGGVADTLLTINNPTDGQQITLFAASSAVDITIATGGNMELEGGGSFVLTNARNTVTLTYNAAVSAWCQTGSSANAV